MQVFIRFLRFTDAAEYWPVLIMRVALGSFFFASGYNKAFNPDGQALMLDTITEAGIPCPELMAVFVAHCEVLFGLLLALGLLTRLSALALFVISLVALVTVAIHQIPPGLNPMAWYSWLLYLPESGYLLISLLLLIAGGGPYAADKAVSRFLLKRMGVE